MWTSVTWCLLTVATSAERLRLLNGEFSAVVASHDPPVRRHEGATPASASLTSSSSVGSTISSAPAVFAEISSQISNSFVPTASSINAILTSIANGTSNSLTSSLPVVSKETDPRNGTTLSKGLGDLENIVQEAVMPTSISRKVTIPTDLAGVENAIAQVMPTFSVAIPTNLAGVEKAIAQIMPTFTPIAIPTNLAGVEKVIAQIMPRGAGKNASSPALISANATSPRIHFRNFTSPTIMAAMETLIATGVKNMSMDARDTIRDVTHLLVTMPVADMDMLPPAMQELMRSIANASIAASSAAANQTSTSALPEANSTQSSSALSTANSTISDNTLIVLPDSMDSSTTNSSSTDSSSTGSVLPTPASVIDYSVTILASTTFTREPTQILKTTSAAEVVTDLTSAATALSPTVTETVYVSTQIVYTVTHCPTSTTLALAKRR